MCVKIVTQPLASSVVSFPRYRNENRTEFSIKNPASSEIGQHQFCVLLKIVHYYTTVTAEHRTNRREEILRRGNIKYNKGSQPLRMWGFSILHFLFLNVFKYSLSLILILTTLRITCFLTVEKFTQFLPGARRLPLFGLASEPTVSIDGGAGAKLCLLIQSNNQANYRKDAALTQLPRPACVPQRWDDFREDTQLQSYYQCPHCDFYVDHLPWLEQS